MIKSKEKILGDNYCFIDMPSPRSIEQIYSAMDEYAKQQSLEFKTWCEELNKIRSGLLIGNCYRDLKTDDQKYYQFIKIKTHETK